MSRLFRQGHSGLFAYFKLWIRRIKQFAHRGEGQLLTWGVLSSVSSFYGNGGGKFPDPALTRRISDIQMVEKVHVIPNYSYQVRRFCGKGFVCVGDAHRFIDPIFSFGISATLREAEFAVPHVLAYLEGKGRHLANPFAEHMLFCEKGTDNLEDMIDLFWEQPFVFAVFVHHPFRDQLIDAFAGRVYESEHQPSPAILAFRKMLNRTRDYEHEDDYSIPIGSRYHPERAALFEPNAPIGTTEEWMVAPS